MLAALMFIADAAPAASTPSFSDFGVVGLTLYILWDVIKRQMASKQSSGETTKLERVAGILEKIETEQRSLAVFLDKLVDRFVRIEQTLQEQNERMNEASKRGSTLDVILRSMDETQKRQLEILAKLGTNAAVNESKLEELRRDVERIGNKSDHGLPAVGHLPVPVPLGPQQPPSRQRNPRTST